MEKQKNIPELRFHEFDAEWQEFRLGELTRWYSGGTPSKKEQQYWEGEIPWISASSMRGLEYSDSELKISDEGLRNGSRLAHKGWLLILVRGSMLFKKIPIGIATRDVAFNQDVKAIEVNSESDGLFILYYLYSKESKLLNIVTGTGIGAGKLDTDDLKSFHIPIPSFPEQQKIASFFTAINKKISQLKQKKTLLEQYKKGVMQKIFSQEIRFRDDTGKKFPKWEKKRLGEISERNQHKNKNNIVTTVLTNSAINGIVLQSEYFDKDIANQNNLLNYYIVEVDDFIYNPRISVHAPVGPIKRNSLCQGVMSPLYSVFRFSTGVLEFFEYYFSTTYWHEYMKGIANYGARSDRMNITTKDLYNMPIPFPTIPEQTKIANFLSSIDDKIYYTQTQIEKAELWKKGLLQQMFV